MWNWDPILKLQIEFYWNLSYSWDSPTFSETKLIIAFFLEDVNNLYPLIFTPVTDPASKLKPQLITWSNLGWNSSTLLPAIQLVGTQSAGVWVGSVEQGEMNTPAGGSSPFSDTLEAEIALWYRSACGQCRDRRWFAHPGCPSVGLMKLVEMNSFSSSLAALENFWCKKFLYSRFIAFFF